MTIMISLALPMNFAIPKALDDRFFVLAWGQFSAHSNLQDDALVKSERHTNGGAYNYKHT